MIRWAEVWDVCQFFYFDLSVGRVYRTEHELAILPQSGLDGTSDLSTITESSRLQKVAADLFLNRGYEGVTIDNIVELAGGSKSTVYSEFGMWPIH